MNKEAKNTIASTKHWFKHNKYREYVGGYIQNLTQSIQERRMTTEGALLRVAVYAYKQDMIRIGYSCIRNKEKTVRKGYNRVAS